MTTAPKEVEVEEMGQGRQLINMGLQVILRKWE
jgi:hypothetical protein